ncbi:hypothetical protein [Dietzia sp.]|uniref:hypothetical protein n=1 Tax=Dietzia sp. TaxID=1871616 RepID=UPI002FDA31E7
MTTSFTASRVLTETYLALEPAAPPGSEKITMVVGWAMFIGCVGVILGIIGSGVWLAIEKITSGSTRSATMMLVGCVAGAIILVSATAIFSAITGWSVV